MNVGFHPFDTPTCHLPRDTANKPAVPKFWICTLYFFNYQSYFSFCPFLVSFCPFCFQHYLKKKNRHAHNAPSPSQCIYTIVVILFFFLLFIYLFILYACVRGQVLWRREDLPCSHHPILSIAYSHFRIALWLNSGVYASCLLTRLDKSFVLIVIAIRINDNIELLLLLLL